MLARGLVNVRSQFGPEETVNRLEAELAAKGMTVFARVDHAAGAEAVGLALQPTEVLIFGNARGGTPLMQAARTIGLDLPIRTLVWQDAAHVTWLTYNDPRWLARRHVLGPEAEDAVAAMTVMVKALAAAATGTSVAKTVRRASKKSAR